MATPPKSTPRRVLGDIAPRALNTPSKHLGTRAALNPSEGGARAQSPLKQVSTLSPQMYLGKENENAAREGPAYPHARKRSIYEVDGAENVEDAKPTSGAREQQRSAWKAGLTAAAMQTHMDTNPVDLPPPGSPTVADSSSSEPEEVEPAPKPLSQESASFSNYFDYSELCLSQGQKSERPPSPPTGQDGKKEKSRAELLRTRLGFGIYKVKTNQTAKRSSDIISTWESSSPETSTSNPSMTTATTSSADATASRPVPSITFSRASATRDTHPTTQFKSVKANLDPGRPIAKLAPGPILMPTVFPPHMPQAYPSNVPSSPPQVNYERVVSPEQLMSPVKSKANYATPVAKRQRLQNYEEDGRDEPLEVRIQRIQNQSFQEADLTSSAVKGNAAKGLMDLMQGRR